MHLKDQRVAFISSSIKPIKAVIDFPKAIVNHCKSHGRDMFLPGKFLQFIQELLCFTN